MVVAAERVRKTFGMPAGSFMAIVAGYFAGSASIVGAVADRAGDKPHLLDFPAVEFGRGLYIPLVNMSLDQGGGFTVCAGPPDKGQGEWKKRGYNQESSHFVFGWGSQSVTSRANRRVFRVIFMAGCT